MNNAFLLAFSHPVGADRDDEYNNWYDNTHVPQLRAALPSIKDVNRYELVPCQEGGHRYLAIFEFVTNDVDKTIAEFGEVVASGRLDPTSAMDTSVNPPVLVWYRPR